MEPLPQALCPSFGQEMLLKYLTNEPPPPPPRDGAEGLTLTFPI